MADLVLPVKGVDVSRSVVRCVLARLGCTLLFDAVDCFADFLPDALPDGFAEADFLVAVLADLPFPRARSRSSFRARGFFLPVFEVVDISHLSVEPQR